MAVFDPSMTAGKVGEMIESAIDINASGKPTGSDAPSVPEYASTKGYIDATRKKGRGMSVDPEVELMAQYKKIPVHIFNVGPFPHIIPCGSAGTFYIPACPEGRPYVEMLTPLYQLMSEIWPSRDKKSGKRLYEEGKRMAVEIMGEGRNQDKRNSKRRVGVFISEGDVPTKKEIEAANAELQVYCAQQIAFMDQLWDRDRKLAYDVYRAEVHGAAARILGLTGKQKPYLMQGASTDKIPCRWCEEPVSPSVPLCHNCKKPVNQEAYLALMAEEQALNEATAPSPKKGK